MAFKETFWNLLGMGRRTAEGSPSGGIVIPTPIPLPGIGRGRFANWLNELGKWRDSHNPLRGLTPAVVTRHIESADRGAQTEYQWFLRWVSREDAVYSALEERSLSALSRMEWDIVISDTVPDNQRAMAEAQQAALKAFYDGLCSLRASIGEVGRARFTGCSFLEKVVTPGGQLELRPVDPWYFVRDGSKGPWSFNPSLSAGVTTGQPMDPKQWVIRTVESPVGRRAVRLFTIKNYGVKNWQGFVEVYGIPAIFGVMPPDIDPTKEDEFRDIMERVIGNARGVLPGNSSVTTVEAKNTGNSPFKELADWCDSQLVISATGGLLTMLTAPGSGTLAGSAHQEAFDMLAAKEAVDVSEIFQEQVDRPFLAEHFAGQPVLAYFKLAPATKHDPDKVIEHAVKLRAAGYAISLDQMKERTGYDIYMIGGPDDPDNEWKAAKAAEMADQMAGDGFPMLDAEDDEDEDGFTGRPKQPPAQERVRNRATGYGATPNGTFGSKAKRVVAKAFNDDFGGIRSMWEALLADLEADRIAVESDEYRQRVEAIDAAIDAMADAEPGTLKADVAMEELNAEGLFHGWTWKSRTVNRKQKEETQ